MSLSQSGSPASSGSRQEAEKADSTFTIKSHSDDEPNGKTLYEDFIFNPELVRVECRDDFTSFLLQPEHILPPSARIRHTGSKY